MEEGVEGVPPVVLYPERGEIKEQVDAGDGVGGQEKDQLVDSQKIKN